ncbi:ATP synthase subunit epsilon, mitochondrial isoform X2 [Miscanthus floridulus]|uniref:ATP synthase subunit epsilon, mitochondrial isoform X2 n=1 Tax=Miscanthus floridulus TaxID=154761 RepID=UPI003458D619
MSATTAAVPFWRAAGMTYIGYSNICAALVRNCLKEPFKSEAASREKVHFSISKWADGKQEKPMQRAPALCGVWGRVLVASLTLACAMRGDRDSNPGPSGHRRCPLRR